MSLTAITYLLILLAGYSLSILKHPFWGLIVYLLVYFINPHPVFHWWGNELPALRWNLISFVVLIISCFLHCQKLNKINIIAVSSGNFLIAFLILSYFLSFFAVDSTASFRRNYEFLRYVLMFFIFIKCITNEKQLIIILLIFLIFGFELGFEAFSGQRQGARLEGIGTVDTSDSNSLGLILATTTFLAFPFFFLKEKLYKLISLCCLIFIFNGIILANSRGAILALIAGSFFVFILSSIKTKKRIVLLFFLGLIGFLYLTDHLFWERFQTITNIETDQGSGRLEIWKHGFEILKANPMGTGGDGFRRLSQYYLPEELLSISGERVPHNTFLLIASEQGWIGLMIYAGFIISSFHYLNKARKKFKNENLFLYMLAISLLGAWICHLAGSFFGDRLYYEFIYYIAALSVLIINIQYTKKLEN